jgi:RNA polymerase sigma-70 factor, ECF subfamily
VETGRLDVFSLPMKSILSIVHTFPISRVTDEPDIQLIQAAQRGDRDAMHRLLAPWNDPIFGFLITSLHNRSDAEDAAQETFIRVVKGLPGYEHRGEFRAWIFRIARNQAALTATRRRRVSDHESGVEPVELHSFAAEDENDDALAAADRAAELRAAVETLPVAEREVIRLRLDEDLKFREIAERTGASLNTVLGRMRNAARRLRAMLDHSGNSPQ